MVFPTLDDRARTRPFAGDRDALPLVRAAAAPPRAAPPRSTGRRARFGARGSDRRPLCDRAAASTVEGAAASTVGRGTVRPIERGVSGRGKGRGAWSR